MILRSIFLAMYTMFEINCKNIYVLFPILDYSQSSTDYGFITKWGGGRGGAEGGWLDLYA